MRLVVDASVYGDAVYSFDSRRTQLVDKFFETIISRGHVIVEPRIFSLELAFLLPRRLGPQEGKRVPLRDNRGGCSDRYS
ncbi:hypothetical protein [Pyrodictium abyssi]|uniref:PIN domain-containing protein n=1 Tax=Pyrodictium abyssi TaxID=54256 RepID=A0ABM8IWA2_9CREN|nr:hypothetical protein PABY_13970 [Pyrodictium abyssi]